MVRHSSAKQRKQKLSLIYKWIRAHSGEIYKAVNADLGRHHAEIEITEIKPLLMEIRFLNRHLKQWMKQEFVPQPLFLQGTKSRIITEPRGVCLIISPWNFPFQLVVGPLISAIAAGNCVVVKPSELSVNTSALLQIMIDELFDPAEVMLVQGDENVGAHLLKFPFDHIFFTGSKKVGQIIMQEASNHLSSVTLELGGINPVIVDHTASLADAADKIVVAKFINAGQICVSPNHVFVHQSVYDNFKKELIKYAEKRYKLISTKSIENQDIARIINLPHWDRLNNLIREADAEGLRKLVGGESNREALHIAPTIFENVSLDSKLVAEEIFGPIIPLIPYQDIANVIDFINRGDTPLALYVFSRSKKFYRQMISSIPAGTTCINDTSIHFYHTGLPFGGLRQSGIGKAHGYAGFLAFSHQRAILKQRIRFASIKMVYPPFTKFRSRIIRFISRYI